MSTCQLLIVVWERKLETLLRRKSRNFNQSETILSDDAIPFALVILASLSREGRISGGSIRQISKLKRYMYLDVSFARMLILSNLI